MLSIGKLAAGAEEYYLSAVAAGVEGCAAMVKRLLTSCAGVEVVVGPAGTGNTFALAACRAALGAAGPSVIGAPWPPVPPLSSKLALGERLGTVELTENRRQRHQLDRFALAHLATADPTSPWRCWRGELATKRDGGTDPGWQIARDSSGVNDAAADLHLAEIDT